MNLVSLEYFLTNKTQNMDPNALLSEKIETIFFAMTRCSLPYILRKIEWNGMFSCLQMVLSFIY